ncbi:MAG: hypothetical protein ACHQQ3_11895 [Gemmatimonadales bacterium]
MLSRTPIACLLALSVSGCSRLRPGAATPSGAPASPVVASPASPSSRRFAIDESARVYYSDAVGLKDSVRLVIRDLRTWTDVWRQVTSEEKSPPPLPSVDFTHEMLVVAGAGRMSPGDQIRVDSIAEVGNTLSVIVRTRVECRKFPGASYPLEAVRVASSSKRVAFEERREKPECGST